MLVCCCWCTAAGSMSRASPPFTRRQARGAQPQHRPVPVRAPPQSPVQSVTTCPRACMGPRAVHSPLQAQQRNQQTPGVPQATQGIGAAQGPLSRLPWPPSIKRRQQGRPLYIPWCVRVCGQRVPLIPWNPRPKQCCGDPLLVCTTGARRLQGPPPHVCWCDATSRLQTTASQCRVAYWPVWDMA